MNKYIYPRSHDRSRADLSANQSQLSLKTEFQTVFFIAGL